MTEAMMSFPKEKTPAVLAHRGAWNDVPTANGASVSNPNATDQGRRLLPLEYPNFSARCNGKAHMWHNDLIGGLNIRHRHGPEHSSDSPSPRPG